MPGICGIIGQVDQRKPEQLVSDMAAQLQHESFYETGAQSFRDAGVSVAWASLPKSDSAAMPVWNERRDICAIISGEFFGDAAQSLTQRGHSVGKGSASCLVHLYEELGPKFLANLNGYFSGLLLDFRENTAFLFTDRFGMNRLYYFEDKDAFYFSSEAKSILKLFPQTRSFRSDSLAEYFSLGCVLESKTLFNGIHLLPPGALWSFGNFRTLQKNSYFQPKQWEEREPLSSAEYYDKLKAFLPTLIKRYTRDGKDVALSLTAGVDSRLILAWLGESKLPCYSFSGPFRESIDVTVARELAKRSHLEHVTFEVGSDFFASFADLARKAVRISEGTFDLRGAVDLYMQRKAGQLAPIRLCGTYGGEILRRLVVFKPSKVESRVFSEELRNQFTGANTRYGQALKCHPLTFSAFRQAPSHIFGPLNLDRSQVVLRSPYFDNDLVSLAYQSPANWASSNALSLGLIADGNKRLSTIPTDRGLLHEPIPVFTHLHHRFQEFTFKSEYAYDYGMPHWMSRLDSSFSALHFERLFLGRHKFYHFRHWYKTELAPFVQEVLLNKDARFRSYLDPKFFEYVVTGHLRGSCNYTTELHRLLAIELIQTEIFGGF